MRIVKSFVVILYSANATNQNLANLKFELIISLKHQEECLLYVEKDDVPNHFINDGCQLFINGILVGIK